MLTGENLTCVRSERVVFREVAFRLEEGDFLMITGDNGSGKSSLLRMMARFIPPFSGRLLWNGAVVDSPRKPSTRYIGHTDALKLSQTPWQTLLFWAGLAEPATAERRVQEALSCLEITDYQDIPNRHLSAGQRRRVSLARLLLSKVALWLIDEPLLTLDRQAQTLFYAMIENYRRTGGMVAATTHVRFPLENIRSLSLS